MLDRFPLTCVCAPDQCYFQSWFGFLKELIIHPHLKEEEKYLGVWLANQCASTISHSCSFSYDQISQMMNKPPRFIHRALLSLRIMGFLSASIPILLSEPTAEMRIEMRVLMLLIPPRVFLDTYKYHEDCNAIFGQYLHHYPYFGMRGESDYFELERTFKITQQLHFKEFGEKIESFEMEEIEVETHYL